MIARQNFSGYFSLEPGIDDTLTCIYGNCFLTMHFLQFTREVRHFRSPKIPIAIG